MTVAEKDCDFEKADICGYSQGRNDDFDWTRGQRKTPTASTGPGRDHTFPGRNDGTV